MVKEDESLETKYLNKKWSRPRGRYCRRHLLHGTARLGTISEEVYLFEYLLAWTGRVQRCWFSNPRRLRD